VYKLAAVMRSMGVEDDELFLLETEVRRLVAAPDGGEQQHRAVDEKPGTGGKAVPAAVAVEAVSRAIAQPAAAPNDVKE
jgi:hypothetical protein